MIILHGENIVASRKYLTDLIEKFRSREAIRFEGKELTLVELKQAAESQSLFGQERLILIENLLSSRPSKRQEELLTYLKSENPKNLVLWEGKKIDGRKLISFSKASAKEFKLTPIIFKFLDSLGPNNARFSLNFLHQTFNQDGPEMVCWMLARQVRFLIMASDLGEKGLPKSLAGWQKAKLVRQAKKFSLEKLLWFYRKLLEIEWQEKTGRASIPLSSSLDLLIASL